MPNLKIFVDETVLAAHRPALVQSLVPLRDCMIRHLGVPQAACQLALVPVIGLSDQPALNAEVNILQAPARTRDLLEVFGAEMRRILTAATGQPCAFRCVQHEAAAYLVMR